jgi:hypothetical protein
MRRNLLMFQPIPMNHEYKKQLTKLDEKNLDKKNLDKKKHMPLRHRQQYQLNL